MNIKNLPKKVLDLFPRWSYQCPNCGKTYNDLTKACDQCGTQYEQTKWRVPPKFLKNYEAMSEYAHNVLAPKLDSKQRSMLFQYFTEFLNDGFESGDFSQWSDTAADYLCSATVESDNPYQGIYNGEFYCSTDSKSARAYQYLSPFQAITHMRIYVKFNELVTTVGGSFSVIRLMWGGWSYSVSAGITNDGGTQKWLLTVTENSNSSNYTSTGTSPEAGVWYCVEIKRDVTNNEQQLWVDGVSRIFATETITSNTSYGECGLIWNSDSSTAHTVYVDCAVIADTYIGTDSLSFSDGFESGNFEQWTGTSTPSPTIVEVPHCGTYSILRDDDNERCYKYLPSSSSVIHVRAYWKLSVLPTTGNYSIVFRAYNASATRVTVEYWNDAGTYKWRLFLSESGESDTYTQTVDVDTWYCLEVRYDATSNLHKLWVDSAEVISFSSTVTESMDRISIGYNSANWWTHNEYIDCVEVADTYIGPESGGETPPESAFANFETCDLSEFDDTDESSGTVTVVGDVSHHGTYSCKCDVNADGSAYAEGYFDVAAQQPLYCRGYFRFNQLPETNRDYTIISFENTSGPTTVGYVQLVDDGGVKKWKMMRDTGSPAYSTSTSNIPEVDTWVCVEFVHGDDLAKLWVNGDELLTHTDTTDQTIDRVHVGACSTDIDADDTLEIHVDCLVVTSEYIGIETDVAVTNLKVVKQSLLHGDQVPKITQDNVVEAIYKWVTSELDGDASSSQNVVSIESVTDFEVGDTVTIKDDNASETNIIASINVPSNDLTMQNNLANTYTQEANATVYEWKPKGFDAINNYLRFNDNDTGNNANLFLVTVTDNNDDPMVVLDQGVTATKNLAVGGILRSTSGVLELGHGASNPTDPPTITLIHTNPLYTNPEYDTLNLSKMDGTYGTLKLNSSHIVHNTPQIPVVIGHPEVTVIPTYYSSGNGNILFEDVTPEDPGNRTYPDGQKTSLYQVMVELPSHPTEYAPFIATDHGFWVEKDIMTYGGLFTNSDPRKSYGGGAILMGHGFSGPGTGPRISLVDSELEIPSGTSFPANPTEGDCFNHITHGRLYRYGYTGEPPALAWIDAGEMCEGYFDTLYLTKASSSSPANLNIGKLIIESADNKFAVTAGDNGANQDAYLIPENPSEGGLGLGTSNYPFKWINATKVFTNGITTISGDLTLYPSIIFDGTIKSSFNPSSDNMYGLGSGGSRWQGVVALTGYFDDLKTTAGSTYVLGLSNMPNQGTSGYVLTAQGSGNPPVWAPAGGGGVTWTAVPSSINPSADNTYALGSGSHSWQGVVAYTMYANDYYSRTGGNATFHGNVTGYANPYAHNHAASDVNSGTFNINRIPSGLNSKISWGSISYNINPSATDTYALGAGGSYWSGVVANAVYYKTLSSFDALDDLELLKNYRVQRITTKQGTEEIEVDIITHDSLDFLKKPRENISDEDFWDAGKVMGYLLGCLKAEVLAREKLETTVNDLKSELKKQKTKGV
ncbi:MAG: hypothetical protein CW691_04625, partial [Candidatus Bathyarchaeum sp.]